MIYIHNDSCTDLGLGAKFDYRIVRHQKVKTSPGGSGYNPSFCFLVVIFDGTESLQTIPAADH